MKLFDVLGGKVIIHEEALAIPAFKKVWEKDKDKQHATAVLSYIVFKNKWDSPYVLSLSTDELESKLKQQFFEDPNYHLTIDEINAEECFKALQYTRTLKMLDSIRQKLDTFTDYYLNSLQEELDEKKIEKYLAGFTKVKDTCLTLDYLEKAVKSGEVDTKKIKGDAKVNPFELPDIGVGR